MTKLFEWVENAAVENLKLHHHTADVLAKEAATTLTVLLAGVAGSLAYTAQAVEKNSWGWLSAGAAAFSAYLMIVSVFLLVKCMMVDELPAIHNEPKNLMHPEIEFDELRRYEFENMQGRINACALRNNRIATSLNRIRVAAVLSPLVFTVIAASWAVLASVPDSCLDARRDAPVVAEE